MMHGNSNIKFEMLHLTKGYCQLS